MERRSKELDITPNKEIILPSEGGLLKYPTESVLTVQIGSLDNNGLFSKVRVGAGCKAILIVLKDEKE